MRKPVIFLAFANDKVDNAAYLRNLPKEMESLRNALGKGVSAGLCEVVERSSATIDQLLDVFQDPLYKDRIAIFHYGGHANGFQLLLESLDGQVAIAHAEGFVPFLARQKGLKLVFLNGCSSQQQAQDMIRAGIPAVIGTSQSIDDGIATSLSARFYNGISAGLGINQAWEEAVDQVKIMKGTSNTRALNWKGKETVEDRFPWDIFYKEGAEIIRKWNLPDAVNNPLFGLPPIPRKYNLPETPFLFLQRYQPEHAEVFFGRSFYIRELYNQVVDAKSPPVILLYGQSGVGKSSLFEAGLYPRLEYSHQVIYLRRDAEKGLWQTLKEGLEAHLNGPQNGLNGENGIAKKTENAAPTIEGLLALAQTAPRSAKAELLSLAERLKQEQAASDFSAAQKQGPGPAGELFSLWEKVVAQQGNPLLIILDQAEELFTRPLPDHSDELEVFLQHVQNAFSIPSHYPQGKLILGYRKEYNPEIEEQFQKYQIPRSRLFLDHLDKKDILDIFRGLTQTPELVARYNLKVEEGLPELIANDILEDKDSPVAPILQILLTKMWEKAVQADPVRPLFSISLYQDLKRDGILLSDFFNQQMEKLRAWDEEVVVSGLALDLLNKHTTEMGTAGTQKLTDLQEKYSHRRDKLIPLLEKLKELILLNEASRGSTGLTHDTLAPLVQLAFKNSDLPGQRASRILTNKALEYVNDPQNLLGEADLHLVESGLAGMQGWNAIEMALIRKSRERRNKNNAMRRWLRIAGMLAVLAILAFALFAGWAYQKASREEEVARKNLVEAERQKEIANGEKEKVIQQSKIVEQEKQNALDAEEKAKAEELKALQAKENALQSQNRALNSEMVAKQEAKKAEEAAQIALQKEEEARKSEQKAIEQQERAEKLRDESVGKALMAKAQRQSDPAATALYTRQGYLFLAGHGLDQSIYPLVFGALMRTNRTVLGEGWNQAKGHQDNVRGLAFTPGGKQFVTAGSDGLIKLWNASEKPVLASTLYQTSNAIRAVEFNANGSRLAFSDGMNGIRVMAFPPAANSLSDLLGEGKEVIELKFAGRDTLLAATREGELYVWNVPGRQVVSVTRLPSPAAAMCAGPGKEGKMLLALQNGELYQWNYHKKTDNLAQIPLSGQATALAVNPISGEIAVGRKDGYISLFKNNFQPLRNLYLGKSIGLTSLAYDPSGSYLAAAAWDGALRLWTVQNYDFPFGEFNNGTGWIWKLAFCPAQKLLVSTDQSGSAWAWPLDLDRQIENLGQKMTRNFYPKEWENEVGAGIPYRKTWEKLPIPKEGSTN
ncbi:MAG: AAA family ATPase [Bacteroidia bacterium]|nr:AAA family ATPase [Bacteroidia bacterium]